MGDVVEPKGAWGGTMEEGESWKTGSKKTAENKEQYLQWLLTPKEAREPKTKTAFAEQIGVTLQTLSNYLKDAAFQRRLANERARLRRVDKAEDVLDHLYRRATGSAETDAAANAAAKIWLDHTFKDLGEDAPDLSAKDLSDDEVQDLAVRVLKKFAERG